MDEWAIDERATEDLSRKRDVLLRIVYHDDPDKWDDDTYARRWNDLVWASSYGFLPFKLK